MVGKKLEAPIFLFLIVRQLPLINFWELTSKVQFKKA
jgi:hypothetical protein